jgi:hypothetical protein
MNSITAMRLGLLLLLAATPVAAEPPADPADGHGLEVVVDAHLRWQGQVLDTPEGLGPGAAASVGTRNGWGAQLSWAYSRFTTTEEFDDDRFDTRVHYVLPGLVRRTAIDRWSFASIAFGVAASRERSVHLPCDGGTCSQQMAPHTGWHAGAWVDARVGMDIVEVAPRQALTVGIALQIVAVQPGAVAASAGIGYHWR